jgi:amino acid permease
MTMQGYDTLSEEGRKSLWLGIRFAPALCFTGIALGVVLASPALLLAMAVTALLGGFILPKHPFDYLYEFAVRPRFGGPAVPPSPAPRRFACQLATPWVTAIAVGYLADMTTVAWALAVPLLVVAASVATTNWCLPSLIYGLLHGQTAEEPSALAVEGCLPKQSAHR